MTLKASCPAPAATPGALARASSGSPGQTYNGRACRAGWSVGHVAYGPSVCRIDLKVSAIKKVATHLSRALRPMQIVRT